MIDLGCDPGSSAGRAWRTPSSALSERGLRVSIDSFDPVEVAAAVAAGAELVLSVNATNRERAADWGVEVVAIPDQPGSLDGLDETDRVPRQPRACRSGSTRSSSRSASASRRRWAATSRSAAATPRRR